MNYDDLIIRIRKRDGAFFKTICTRVVLRNGRVRETKLSSDRSLHPEPLLRQLPEVRRAMLESLYKKQGAGEIDAYREFGRLLYHALFDDHGPQEFENPYQNALRVASGLRIRLDLPDELQCLPWELLCPPKEVEPYDFLSLVRQMAIVRSSDTDTHEDVPKTDWPLRILIVVSTPTDQSPLMARDEIDQLIKELEQSIRSGIVQLDFVHGADTLRRLTLLLNNSHPPIDILHFIGHGTHDRDSGSLIMEDGNHQSHKLSAKALYQNLNGPHCPRLIILNACETAAMGSSQKEHPSGLPFTSVAGGLVCMGIPGVVAHQMAVSDPAAQFFSAQIYDRLAQEEDEGIDTALWHARNALGNHTGLPAIESFTPVLFLSSRTGHLFRIRNRTAIGKNEHFDRTLNAAREAEQRHLTSQALDYATLAVTLNENNTEASHLHKRLRVEEQADLHLHEAQFAESCRNWPSAVCQYTKYNELYQFKFDEQQRELRRGEHRNVELLKAISQAALGTQDPLLNPAT